MLNLVTYVVLHSKVENNFLDNHEASYIYKIRIHENKFSSHPSSEIDIFDHALQNQIDLWVL